MHTNQFTTASRRYLVASYGSGWAYTITDQHTRAEFFVQDDSAAQVQFQTNYFDDEAVIAEFFDLLAHEE